MEGILLSRCVYELLRGPMLCLGLKERSKYAFDKMQWSTPCTIHEFSSAMGRSKKVNQARKEIEEQAL